MSDFTCLLNLKTQTCILHPAQVHQFLMKSAAPEKERKFQALKAQHKTVFAFHGSRDHSDIDGRPKCLLECSIESDQHNLIFTWFPADRHGMLARDRPCGPQKRLGIYSEFAYSTNI
jgi:hypothetical protein